MKQFSQFVVMLVLFLFSGLSFSKGISIDAPYVREVPPGQMNSASFLTLKNATDKEIALIKATSDVAKHVELHEHVHGNGMMKMRQVAKIIIPAHGETVLKPGGYHVMLIGLTRKIKAGDMIELELEFDNGDKHPVKAEVKKILQGMMKQAAKHAVADDIKVNKHVNPMPNLMRVYENMGDKLHLTAEQKVKLDASIKEHKSKMVALTQRVMKIEKEIKDAFLNEASIGKIDQLANNLMQERLAIIKEETLYKEKAKQILDKKQFAKMATLYRENFMAKSKMNKEQAEIAMKAHTNPMPNLMLVVEKMADKLNLSKQQANDLKMWRDERAPVIAKQYQSIMKQEADILERALNNAPEEMLAPLADGIMQVRMKIIRGKIFCRENMKRILDDKQYATVKALYKANYQ